MTGTISSATARSMASSLTSMTSPTKPRSTPVALPSVCGGSFFPTSTSLPAQADGAAAELDEPGDDDGIDLVIEHVLDDADRLLIGHAQAIDEARLQPGLAHPLGDRLAAAVDQHRVDADGFEEDDIAQKTLDDVLVFHRAAAVFDDEKLRRGNFG